mgnify:FL=1
MAKEKKISIVLVEDDSFLANIYQTKFEMEGFDIAVALQEGAGAIDAVEVNGETITAERILVAVGGWPSVPEIPGREHVITSNEFFFMDALPKRVIVVGGGYIAVELAGVLNGLGSQVTQLYRGPHFLRGFDDDVRHFLAGEIRKKGIDLRFNANIAKVDKRENGILVATLEDGSTMEADTILYATGRAPNTAGLGLEDAGVELAQDGAIARDSPGTMAGASETSHS